MTEQDFNYSVTYKIDGETKTFSGVYTCRFTGFGGVGFDSIVERITVDDNTQLTIRLMGEIELTEYIDEKGRWGSI